MEQAFLRALASRGPHPSLGVHADTYGRVIGSYRGVLENHLVAPVSKSSIEVHFGWVLEGRAVQDVWITPARQDRESAGSGLSWYGTTLRVFDPERSIWRVTWTCPVSRHHMELEGTRRGDDVVQLGMRDGRPIRWTFSNIRERSFRWEGEALEADGATWRLEISIVLERTNEL